MWGFELNLARPLGEGNEHENPDLNLRESESRPWGNAEFRWFGGNEEGSCLTRPKSPPNGLDSAPRWSNFRYLTTLIQVHLTPAPHGDIQLKFAYNFGFKPISFMDICPKWKLIAALASWSSFCWSRRGSTIPTRSSCRRSCTGGSKCQTPSPATLPVDFAGCINYICLDYSRRNATVLWNATVFK